jgi:hypothetical protein
MAETARVPGQRRRLFSDTMLFAALLPLCILNAVLLAFDLLVARSKDTIAFNCNGRPSCIAASHESWAFPAVFLFGVLGPIVLLAFWYRGETRSIAPLVASVVIAAVPLLFLLRFLF